MKTNLILTPAVAMFVAMPSMAAPSHSSNTFPTDGKMQADYTYTNAATSDNMAGVYENSVYANAQYTTNNYTVGAGYYLPADSENSYTRCTAGSFCPGLPSPVQYNATTAQGIESCPTGYTNSAEGAKANTECYRTCSNSDVAHASSVRGQMYYDGTSGDGVNACAPESCVNGWHVKAGVPDLATIIGNGGGGNSAAITGYGDFLEDGASKGQSYYGITENNTFAVEYGNKGMIKGQARCSTQSGTNNDRTWSDPTIVSNLTDETGQTGAKNCYCNVTGYKDTNGTMQSLSAPWVFYTDEGDAGGCRSVCVTHCSNYLRYTYDNGAFRAAVFRLLGTPSPASCEANTITINWSDAAQTDIDANNAGSVTYGGNINTPVKAATKKGKTFRGWIFSTTAPSNE